MVEKYSYKDHDGDKLEMWAAHPSTAAGQLRVYLVTDKDGVYLDPEEAPAFCKAVLEMAGYDDCEADWYAGQALANLRMVVQQQAEKKAREEAQRAADAKVEEFMLHQLEAQGLTGPTWKQATDEERGAWRVEYESAKAFFAAELAPPEPVKEPVTLEFGAPEPDHDTLWTSEYIRSGSGSPANLQYDQRRGGWTWGTCAATMPWENLGRHMFPLEQVAE